AKGKFLDVTFTWLVETRPGSAQAQPRRAPLPRWDRPHASHERGSTRSCPRVAAQLILFPGLWPTLSVPAALSPRYSLPCGINRKPRPRSKNKLLGDSIRAARRSVLDVRER